MIIYDAPNQISVDEYDDGEIFSFTEIQDKETVAEMFFTRDCAKQIVNLLMEMIGEDEEILDAI